MSIFEYDKEGGRTEAAESRIRGRKRRRDKGGELQKAKETAAVMNKMKFPVEKIAEVLQVDKNAIMEWIKEK